LANFCERFKFLPKFNRKIIKLLRIADIHKYISVASPHPLLFTLVHTGIISNEFNGHDIDGG